MGTSIYSFEGSGRRKLEGDDANQAILEFLGKLAINIDINSRDNKDTIIDFILHHHVLISKYQKLRQWKKIIRCIYMVISITLLLIIPSSIFYISNKLPGNPEVVATELTALLTGLIAVHKSMSSWLDQRTIVGNFWKAESELKGQLYEFEDRWRGNAMEKENMKEEFIEEMRKSVKKAKDIQRTEQDQFFNSYTYPTIDIAGILSGSVAQAKDLVKSHISPTLTNREATKVKIIEHETTIKQLDGEITAIKMLIQEKEKGKALATGMTESIDEEIKRLTIKLRESEDKKILVNGMLESLRI